MRAVLPSSVQKKITFLSDAGISFQDAAVSVVTNEQMQEGKRQRRNNNKGITGLVTSPKFLRKPKCNHSEQPPCPVTPQSDTISPPAGSKEEVQSDSPVL